MIIYQIKSLAEMCQFKYIYLTTIQDTEYTHH